MLTVLFLAGLAAQPALADFRHVSTFKADQVQREINQYRNGHGRVSLRRSIDVELASNAHAWAMYRGAYWGGYLWTRASPYWLWIRLFVSEQWRAAELRQYRCRNRPFTPAIAVHLMFLAKPHLLLYHNWNRVGIEWQTFRRSAGKWAGKGKCRMVVVNFAGP